MYKPPTKRGAFGASLLQIRRGLGMNLQRFADIIGVSKTTVWRWENARALPAPQAFNAIINFLEERNEQTFALREAYSHCVAIADNNIKE